MEPKTGGWENIFFVFAAAVALLLAAMTYLLQGQVHLHHARMEYGFEHLPAAFLAIAVFSIFASVARTRLLRMPDLGSRSTLFFLTGLTVVFVLYWSSALLSGGFVQDDWMLLAAASIRKVLFLHPHYTWYTLDTVDGNFRPLGTVLYIGYMLRWFGLSPLPFLLGLFVTNLLGCLVLFLIVREMGYSRLTGAAAAILYISRGITYTIHTWISALGDSLVILLCGVTILLLLCANRSRGGRAVLCHVVAWVFFFLATLAKQSSFAVPLIVAMLLFLHPGEDVLPPLRQRIRNAVLGLTIYIGTAWLIFHHGKLLSQINSPYPMEFSWEAAFHTFAYIVWYFTTFDLPRGKGMAMVPDVAGALIAAGLIYLVYRVPRLLGERPRDVLFATLSTFASLSLFIVLGTRSAPYYGSMAAFWMSVVLAILLTRMGEPAEENPAGRLCFLIFCMLAVWGFAEIRLKQTAIISSGGYIWGTQGIDEERSEFQIIRGLLGAVPEAHTVVLQNFPGYPSYEASMVLLLDPAIEHILVYNSSSKSYFVNDQDGLRPGDSFKDLQNSRAYNWTTSISAEKAHALLSQDHPVWLRYRQGTISLEE